MSSDLYVKSGIETVQTELNFIGLILTGKPDTPIQVGYWPEINISLELPRRRLKFYQGLVGTLPCICELGRIDIAIRTCLLTSYLMATRQRHLQQAIHIFN